MTERLDFESVLHDSEMTTLEFLHVVTQEIRYTVPFLLSFHHFETFFSAFNGSALFFCFFSCYFNFFWLLLFSMKRQGLIHSCMSRVCLTLPIVNNIVTIIAFRTVNSCAAVK